MSVVLYDGKGNIGYYTCLIKAQGGYQQDYTLHFERENIFVATLGENIYNLIIQNYMNEFVKEFRISIQREKFKPLELIKYITKETKELFINHDSIGHFTTLIYDGTTKSPKVYIIDKNGLDQYNSTNIVSLAIDSELYKGALAYSDDLQKVMERFSQEYNHLNSPYNIVKMRT